MTYKEALYWHTHNGATIEQERESEILIRESLEKQIPKKPYLDNDNGIYQKEYCPTCHRSLFPNDHHCKCGQSLDWGN